MLHDDILLADISLRLPIMQAMRLALTSKSMLETVGTLTKNNRPEYKLVQFTNNFGQYIRKYMMERHQLKTRRYLRMRNSDWAWGDEASDPLSLWNHLTVFVKGSTVPTLNITFDCAKSLNSFNIWWYLPNNRGSTEFDVTFEDDVKGTISYFKPKPYTDGLCNGLLEQGYLSCEENIMMSGKKRKIL